MEPLFDARLLARRRARALARLRPGDDFLFERAGEELAARLAVVERRFGTAVQIDPFGPALARHLRPLDKADRWTDCPIALEGPAAVETVPLEPQSAGLIVSALRLHLVNDVPGVLLQLRRALVPDGLFLAAVPASGTLEELRQSLLQAETELRGGAAPRIVPFADVRDYGALLQRAGFALPVADADTLTVRYDTMFALMRDLRAMGMTNALSARSGRPLARDVFMRAAAIYAERFRDPDGRIRATFAMVYLSGWAPHESQQKPLRPGSARMRLADALKTTERKA